MRKPSPAGPMIVVSYLTLRRAVGILGITLIGQGLETYNLQSSIGPLFSPIDFPSSIFLRFVLRAVARSHLTAAVMINPDAQSALV